MLSKRSQTKRWHTVWSIYVRFKDRYNWPSVQKQNTSLGEAMSGRGHDGAKNLEGGCWWSAWSWWLLMETWGLLHDWFQLVRIYPTEHLGSVHFSKCRLDFNKKSFLKKQLMLPNGLNSMNMQYTCSIRILSCNLPLSPQFGRCQGNKAPHSEHLTGSISCPPGVSNTWWVFSCLKLKTCLQRAKEGRMHPQPSFCNVISCGSWAQWVVGLIHNCWLDTGCQGLEGEVGSFLTFTTLHTQVHACIHMQPYSQRHKNVCCLIMIAYWP